jgi:PIN domain nuclease of toxin-antitoxin system
VRALLDTHALIWWLNDNPLLSRPAYTLIADARNLPHVSAASAWEIATKFRIGKLPGAAEFVGDIPAAISTEGFTPLDVTVAHAQRAGLLPGPLRDPFDRLLIAQAQAEDLTLVSNERVFDAYGIHRVW